MYSDSPRLFVMGFDFTQEPEFVVFACAGCLNELSCKCLRMAKSLF